METDTKDHSMEAGAASGEEGATAAPLLSAPEARILGCLIEKERTTPEVYPLSLNSLVNACNQTTNRDPIVHYDDKIVMHGLDQLRQKKLVKEVWVTGSRVQKYKHSLLEVYELNQAEVAVLCVLLLRGPQTLGELRTRTERLFAFSGLDQVDATLKTLMEGKDPLAKLLPAGPGQKEKRFAQTFSAEPELKTEPVVQTTRLVEEGKLQELMNEVQQLKVELASLRGEFTQFKKQFE